MPKAFGWAADRAGCYYYRLAQPLDTLSSTHGWDVSHDTRFPGFPDGKRIAPDDPRLNGIAREAAEQFDTIMTQRTCNPAPTIFFGKLCEAGAFIVYEIDDDLFNIDHRSNPSGFAFYSRPDIRVNVKSCVSMASRVTVSTPKLAEVISQYNSDVRVCPNAVPEWLLTQDRTHSSDDGKVVIGWGGSMTHAMDFEECGPQLRRLFEWRKDVSFHTIGANYTEWMKLPADRVRRTGWTPDVPEYYKAIDFDIGIAPLRPHIFNHSKSYIKALEYAALGIPVVASDVGPYRNFVQHGVTGFLVRREHEWSRYLRVLIEEPALRAEMGANARELASGYTNTALAETWRKALTEDL